MRKLVFLITLIISILFLNCHLVQYKYDYTNNRAQPSVPTKRTIPIYVDKEFSTQDKLAIDNAIGQWNYVLNGQIVLKVVSYSFDMEPAVIRQAQRENAFLFLKVTSDAPGIPDDMPPAKCRITPNCGLTLAWTDRIGGTIMKVVRDRISGEDVEYVVLHEIGHLLYLSHVPEKDSLMYARYDRFRYLCIDRDSALKVSKTYGLDFNHMNYCVGKY